MAHGNSLRFELLDIPLDVGRMRHGHRLDLRVLVHGGQRLTAPDGSGLRDGVDHKARKRNLSCLQTVACIGLIRGLGKNFDPDSCAQPPPGTREAPTAPSSPAVKNALLSHSKAAFFPPAGLFQVC